MSRVTARRAVAAPLAPLRQRMSRDDGTSLVELMVGMMLMAIFLSMFTGAVVMMYSAMNKSQAVNLTSSQLNVAFANLDNTVRYATAISPPGLGASGEWYEELRTTNTGAEVCTQLRVDMPTQQLQRRAWTVVNGVGSTASAWAPISSNISNGGAPSGPSSQPFYLNPSLPNSQYQQLTVNLVAPAGSGTSLTNSVSSFTLTAVNSSVPAPTAPICQQQGRP